MRSTTNSTGYKGVKDKGYYYEAWLWIPSTKKYKYCGRARTAEAAGALYDLVSSQLAARKSD